MPQGTKNLVELPPGPPRHLLQQRRWPSRHGDADQALQFTIVDRGTIEFQADWLWNWRQSVPWNSERSSSVNRLFPDAPERMYIYRYNLLLVEG